MKKSLVAISLIGSMLLAGCGSKPEQTIPISTTVPETTIPPTTVASEPMVTAPPSPVVSISGSKLTLGNIEFAIPNGFTATVIDDNTVALSSLDGDCTIGLFSADIGKLDESKARAFLPMQHQSFVSDDIEKIGAETVDGFIAGRDVQLELYGSLASDNSVSTYMNATFTDSWYSYTVLFECKFASKLMSDYMNTFIEMTGYAKYIGEAPRFDFVQ